MCISFDNVKYNNGEEDSDSSSIFNVGGNSIELGALFLDNKDFEKEDIIELSICSYEKTNTKANKKEAHYICMLPSHSFYLYLPDICLSCCSIIFLTI